MQKNFRSYRSGLEKRKSQQESIQEQLQNQLEEPIFAWLCEEIQQKLKADSGLQQDQSSSKAVHHQQEGQEVSLLLQQGKKASEWLKQQQDILKQKQKDLTALLSRKTSGDPNKQNTDRTYNTYRPEQPESAADSGREVQT